MTRVTCVWLTPMTVLGLFAYLHSGPIRAHTVSKLRRDRAALDTSLVCALTRRDPRSVTIFLRLKGWRFAPPPAGPLPAAGYHRHEVVLELVERPPRSAPRGRALIARSRLARRRRARPRVRRADRSRACQPISEGQAESGEIGRGFASLTAPAAVGD
jgi:hypothetical protein